MDVFLSNCDLVHGIEKESIKLLILFHEPENDYNQVTFFKLFAYSI